MLALVLLYFVGAVSSRGPFFRACSALRNAIPFSGVGAKSCMPTVHRNVHHRGTRVRTVVHGPRIPAFTGAILTCRGSNRVLRHIDAMFNGLLDTRASSSLRRLTGRVVPVVDRRRGGVDLGRRLFTHVGTICRRRSGRALDPRRRGLLRSVCGNFMHGNTGLLKRSGRGCQTLYGRLDLLALRFDRGGLGRAGSCGLIVASGSRLTKLPRDTMRTTTRATKRGNIRN